MKPKNPCVRVVLFRRKPLLLAGSLMLLTSASPLLAQVAPATPPPKPADDLVVLSEGTDNFTSFVRNRAGGVADQVASDPARANRILGMGTAGASGIGVNTAWGNFQSNNNITFDLYNIDAVEISRGPNSNLFGLGAASGTVNLVPSYANPERASYGATLRFDDWGGHRESLNLNQPLIKDKLALRVAAVNESKGFTRKPAEEDINRQYGFLGRQRIFPS